MSFILVSSHCAGYGFVKGIYFIFCNTFSYNFLVFVELNLIISFAVVCISD